MWDNLRIKVLKLISLLAIFSFIYPVVMIARNFCFNTGKSTLDYAVIVLVVSMGIGVTALLCRKSYSLLRLLGSYFAVILPIASTIAIYSSQGIARTIFEAAVVAVFYVIGINACLYSYDRIFNYQRFIMGTIFLFFPLLVVFMNDRYMHLKNETFLFSCLFIFLSLIIITQDNIDFVIQKRGVESADVQRKIRRFNIGIVLVFYAFILFLLNFNKIVLLLISGIRLVCGILMDFIIYILKLLFREKAGVVYEDGFGFMPFDPQPAWKPIIVLIFYTLIHFVFLLSIYFLLPVIYKGIKSLIALIKSKLSQLINTKPDSYNINNGEFEEKIEIVNIIVPKIYKQKTNMLLLLDKTYDLSEKIRLMYKILLNSLMENGVAIQKSDTTGEIYEKSSNVKSIGKHFLSLTNTYNKVRYGEIRLGDNAFNKIKDEFDKIRGLLNTNTTKH